MLRFDMVTAFSKSPQKYFRCFIAAPFGIDLGILPILLGERQIGWNWDEEPQTGPNVATWIQRCDFVIAVLSGTRSDQNVLYEVGIAQGLKKPVFVVATNKTATVNTLQRFPVVELKLTDREGLAFQLDAFLSTPHRSVFDRDTWEAGAKTSIPTSSEPPPADNTTEAVLAGEVYDAVVAAGGSVIVEPKNNDTGLRPDLLIWLSQEDPEFFDPAVVEIKRNIDASQARKAEQQLLKFMQISGIRCGILLTPAGPPLKRRLTSPLVFWLSLNDFVHLTRTHGLSQHIRTLRNQAAHGAE